MSYLSVDLSRQGTDQNQTVNLQKESTFAQRGQTYQECIHFKETAKGNTKDGTSFC